MPVLVTGATGVVGRALIPKLLASGGQVRVYVRRDVPEFRSIGVHVAVGEADHEGKLEAALEQVHTLVHLVGGPLLEGLTTIEWLNLETTQVALRAAENADVRRVLFLSHLGADEESDHLYLVTKARAEDEIRKAPMEHVILRCAPILGPGSVFTGFLESGVVRGQQRVTPVAAEDVAEALVAADTREAELRGTWELGGPDVLTLDDLGRAVPKRGLTRFLSGPPRALSSLYARDLVADSSEAVRQFGLTLTGVAPAVD